MARESTPATHGSLGTVARLGLAFVFAVVFAITYAALASATSLSIIRAVMAVVPGWLGGENFLPFICMGFVILLATGVGVVAGLIPRGNALIRWVVGALVVVVIVLIMFGVELVFEMANGYIHF